jgi:gliding motility-associated-like protein
MGRRDACDSLHIFEVPLNLDISTCPIVLDMVDPPGALCAGTCTDLVFETRGCLGHAFTWIVDGGGTPFNLSDSSTTGLTICPPAEADDMVLELFVEQPSTGMEATFNWTFPVENPVWDIAPAMPPFCSAVPGPVLIAIPPNGTFGGGPVDPATGLINATGLNGPIDFTYESLNGCLLDTSLVFEWLEAGPDLTTCLGGDDLVLTGQGVSGTWSGGGVTPAGLYAANSTGVDTLVIASDNCTDTMLIEVILQEPPIAIPQICANEAPFYLPDLPTLGTWTGPGVSGNNGLVNPEDLSTGSVTWTYVLAGCSQLATSNVLPIAVQPSSFVTCPEEDGMPAYTSTFPTGGSWSGPGVVASGTFYPGIAPEAYDLPLIYTATNGCTDTVFVSNVQTHIGASFIESCQGLDPVEVHDAGWDFQPWCGQWSGPGFSSGGGCEWWWNPANVPPGEHTLVFTANTCVDSVTVTVWPDAVDFVEPAGQILCELAPPFLFAPGDLLPGGTWNGAGLSPTTGLFDPAAAGPGVHDITWTAPGGCVDTTSVTVEAWHQATFGSLADPWCHASAAWSAPGLFPTSSTWTLDGVPTTAFSMDTLSPGPHVLTVAWAGEACASSDTVAVFFEEPLVVALSVADTLLCPLSGTTASAVADGGVAGGTYGWAWSHGGFPTNTTTFLPEASQHLVVTLSDGCSDDASDSVWVEVAPAPDWSWTSADIRCFGEPSEGTLVASPAIFELIWEDDVWPVSDLIGTDTVVWALSAEAGEALALTLVDGFSGCTHDTVVSILSYSPLSAGFQPNPGLGPDSTCVPWELAPIAMLDFSAFVQQGLWWATDDEGEVVWSEAYLSGQTALFPPPLPGPYTLHLAVENEGGCADAASSVICVSPPTEWFLPDNFSPNGDGLNDRLRVHSEPLESFEMQVFNRFGERIATLNDPDEGWDGLQRGTEAPPGAYGVRLDMLFTTGVHLLTNATILLVR